jgi:osmotically-inducible protein OsmY
VLYPQAEGWIAMEMGKRVICRARSMEMSEDARVEEAVARALVATGRIPRGRVAVTSSDGAVRLRGRVSTYYQKQIAQTAALNVVGARQLINDVEVA